MIPVVGYIDESDLDLILSLDAVRCGPLTARLGKPAGFPRLTRTPSMVRRSGSRSWDGRETDVQVEWPERVLLVEHKVSAGFAEGQVASYVEEVRQIRETGRGAAAVLVCPDRRKEELRVASGGAFDAIVTFIELAECAEEAARAGDQLAAAAALVYRAGEHVPTRVRTPEDPERSRWGTDYRSVVDELRPPDVAFRIGDGGLRTTAAVDATFSGLEGTQERCWKVVHSITGEVRAELAPNYRLDRPVPAGWRLDRSRPKQCHVVRAVQPLDPGRHPAEQREAVAEAVAAAVEIHHWLATLS